MSHNADHAAFLALLQPFDVDSLAVDALFAGLVAAYTGPTRFYHTLGHIRQMLATVDTLQSLANDLAAVRLAAWFHDVVYDSAARDNEERSAKYAAAALGSLGLPAGTIATIERLILDTAHHQAPAGDVDSQILIDADLAILGALAPDYRRYTGAIRQEYAWLPEEVYEQGRVRVLKHFLQRERLYYTEPLFERLETPARQNLANEIEELDRGDF